MDAIWSLPFALGHGLKSALNLLGAEGPPGVAGHRFAIIYGAPMISPTLINVSLMHEKGAIGAD
eukprot:6448539-Alexandrium_andersonii.AAC.1